MNGFVCTAPVKLHGFRWLMTWTRRICLVWFSICVVALANDSRPHPHRGCLPRFEEGRPQIELSEKDWAQVDAGKLWTSSSEENGVGRGIAVKHIRAPPSVVYQQVSSIGSYVGKVPSLKALETYFSTKRGSETVQKAKYTVKVVPGFYFNYFVEHRFISGHTVIFSLDYDRRSDFDDLQGKWFIEAHPSRPSWSRVYYQCDLKLFGRVPSIVKTLLTTQGLATATAWVQRESEKADVKDAAMAYVIPWRRPTGEGTSSTSPCNGISVGTLLPLCALVVAGSWRSRFRNLRLRRLRSRGSCSA